MRQTIENKDGELKECEAVDAREHIATGRWFLSGATPKVEKPNVDLKAESLQREQITKQVQAEKVRKSKAK